MVRTWAGLTVSVDGAPVLGEVPGIPGFFNAVSTNGYTLGPALGRLTAELMTTGRAHRDVTPFSIARFG